MRKKLLALCLSLCCLSFQVKPLSVVLGWTPYDSSGYYKLYLEIIAPRTNYIIPVTNKNAFRFSSGPGRYKARLFLVNGYGIRVPEPQGEQIIFGIPNQYVPPRSTAAR